MTNGGDAAEQIVRISLDGVEYALKIAGAGAKSLASLIAAAMKTQKTKGPALKVAGHERLKRMIKSGTPLDVFPVKEKDIRTFTQEAKKYGIVYCAVREKKPKADGMVDVLVRKEDSPKINRIMERLQYAALDKASIKSEIVKNRAEKGAEPSEPDKSNDLDVDSFLDSVLPDEDKAKQEQNQAIQSPAKEKAAPEAQPETFFDKARTKENPSAHGSGNISRTEGTNTDVNSSSLPSVKEEIKEIRAELKEKAQSRKREEPQRSKSSPQQTTRHRQPQSKKKDTKER